MFLFPVLTLKIECSWPLVFEFVHCRWISLLTVLWLILLVSGFCHEATFFIPLSLVFSLSLSEAKANLYVSESCTTFISGQEFSSSVLICTEWNPNVWFLIAAFLHLLNNSQINSFTLPLWAPEQQGWFLKVFYKCLHSKIQQMSLYSLNFNEAV